MNKIVIGPILVIVIALVSACMPIQAQSGTQGAMTVDTKTDTGAVAPVAATADQKIQVAMRAAGPTISQDATIMDWPAEPGGEMTVLREGTNGWTCLPPFWPHGVGHPMCADDVWLASLKAQWAREEPPQVTVPAVAYMLDGGGGPSISDPFATEPPPGEDWGRGGPHLMILTPGDLGGYNRTPGVEPWVMYPDTPFAHLMVGVPMPDSAQAPLGIPIEEATADQKIQEAMRAAGPAISQDATIMDWPAEPGGEFTVLREGANDWTCLPPQAGMPEGVSHSMCLDPVWLAFMKAKWAREELPPVTTPGIAYMLDGGGGPSISDPFAMEPPPGEDWGRGGPHIMLLTPGDLSGFGRTPGPAPWVMFPDTSFVHLMITVPMPEK